mgnify:CR=1 FL=1
MIRCPDPACADAFDLALAREFSDPEYFAVHQLTVAAYRLEHPEGTSDHALAVLREVLRASCDDGLDGPALRRHVRETGRRLRDDPPAPLPRPVPRHPSGVLAVAGARDAGEHVALVRAWALRLRDA